MDNILYTIWENTFGIIVDFINMVIADYGGGASGMDNIPIKVGFGSVEWLNTELQTLFVAVTSIILGVIFIILVWKVFKFFTKLVNRAFGGRKW